MKTLRYALFPLLLVLLAACGQQPDAPPLPTAQPGAGAPGSQAVHPDPVEGQHYVRVSDPAPYQPEDGKIEVVEIFGYTCGACAGFEPVLESWKQRQPDDVRLTLLAAPFGGYWEPYAKAYYAADSLGLAEATHKAMFDAIHFSRTLPVNGATTEAISAFYASHGADAREFARTMEGFGVSGQMRRARQFVDRVGADSTPAMVVNGKYLVVPGQQYDDVLRTVDYLVALERGANAAQGPVAEAGADPDPAADGTAETAEDDPAGDPDPQ